MSSQYRPGQLAAVVANAMKNGMLDPKDLLPRKKQAATVPLAPETGQSIGNKPQGKGKPRGRAPMNKTEQSFANILEARRRRGEIHSWEREGITLRWPDGMSYSPDFAVVEGTLDVNGRTAVALTFIETKGAYIHEDALVKFRAARAHWPLYRFEMHQLAKGEWTKIL